MAAHDRKTKDKELSEEIDLHDDMIASLVELLEEKGVLKPGEWESRIKKKTEESLGLENFRDLP